MNNHRKDRDRAIAWARKTMAKDFVVLDTETTGLAPEAGDEAVSIALVSKAGNILLGTLLRHRRRSSSGARRTHGHTWEATREAPPWAEVLPRVKEIIGDRPVLCYCVNNFDANIILSTCKAHKTERLDLRDRTIQALYPAAEFYGEWNDYHGNYKWQRLTTIAAHLGIDTAGAHGAAADALMTLKVVERMSTSAMSNECQVCLSADYPLEAGLCPSCHAAEVAPGDDAARAGVELAVDVDCEC